MLYHSTYVIITYITINDRPVVIIYNKWKLLAEQDSKLSKRERERERERNIKTNIAYH